MADALSRLHSWLTDHELCPCAVTCRLVYGEPAPLGWLPKRLRLFVTGIGNGCCDWLSR